MLNDETEKARLLITLLKTIQVNPSIGRLIHKFIKAEKIEN